MASLSSGQIHQFITQGFVRIDHAFSKELAAECRQVLWQKSGYDPMDASTWKEPVVRIGECTEEVFVKAANAPILQAAFDQLVGPEQWLPKRSLGSFPIRFPSKEMPTDTGWHVDASFPGEDVYNYLEWRVNIFSKDRGLLMLFLLSEVGEKDAPTLLRLGSHQEVARILEPFGTEGLSFMDLAQKLNATENLPSLAATGEPGTVYLCHPLMVHAAQAHTGKNPKFMAQPSLMTRKDFDLKGDNAVEKAIVLGLDK